MRMSFINGYAYFETARQRRCSAACINAGNVVAGAQVHADVTTNDQRSARCTEHALKEQHMPYHRYSESREFVKSSAERSEVL